MRTIAKRVAVMGSAAAFVAAGMLAASAAPI